MGVDRIPEATIRRGKKKGFCHKTTENTERRTEEDTGSCYHFVLNKPRLLGSQASALRETDGSTIYI